jgi:hypothetical protein
MGPLIEPDAVTGNKYIVMPDGSGKKIAHYK